VPLNPMLAVPVPVRLAVGGIVEALPAIA